MMKKLTMAKILALMVILAFGCTPSQTRTSAPSPTFDILSNHTWLMEGVVLNVLPYESKLIDFGEIKEQSDEISTPGRISFTEDCLVWKVEGQEIQLAGLSGLAIGQRIKFNAEYIRESHPFQAQATEVLILTPGALESSTPISTFLSPEFTGTITSIEEYVHINTTKLIDLHVTSSPKYPDLNETRLALAYYTLLWQQTATGYLSVTEDALKPGQLVSVLLTDHWSKDIYDYAAFQGIVQEIIIIP